MPSLPRIVYRKPLFEPLVLGYGPACADCGVPISTRWKDGADGLCGDCMAGRYGITGTEFYVDYMDGELFVDRDWHGFWLDYIGRTLAGEPEDPRPYFKMSKGDDTEIIEVRVLRAFCDGYPIAAIQQWDPVTGYHMNYAVKDPLHTPTERDLTRIRQLRRFMWLHIETRGRHRLEQEQDQSWRQIAERAIALKQKNPKLTWPIIAEHHFNISARTLRDYRNRLNE